MCEENIRATNDFDFDYCIGSGGYGSVYKAKPPLRDVLTIKKFYSQPIMEMENKKVFSNKIRALTEI